MRAAAILKKNFQLLTNNKLSTIILILGPIILIGLIGLALQDTSIKNLQGSIYSEVGEELTSELNAKLTSTGISSTREVSLENCRKKVREGISHLCIHFTETKNKGIVIGYNINLHVDFSKQRTVWSMIGKVQAIGGAESGKARNIFFNQIKSGSKEIANKIANKNQEIAKTITKLQALERTISGLDSKKKISLNTINEAQSSLKTISDLVDDFSEESEDLPQVRRIKSSLDQVKNNLNKAEQSINAINLIYAKQEIQSAIRSLKETKNLLDSVQNDLKDLQNTDFNQMTNPITVSHQSVLDDKQLKLQNNLQFLDYLFPNFLIFFIIFNATIFAANTRIAERKAGSYIRNISSKTNGFYFVLSDLFSSFIVIAIQTFTIVWLASFFLNSDFSQNIAEIGIIVGLCVFIFSLIGTTIGSIFNTSESSTIAAICISILFFVFSSMITPLETLPAGIANIIKMLPLTLLESKLNMVMVFNLQNTISASNIFALLITVSICGLLIAIFYKKNKEQLI